MLLIDFPLSGNLRFPLLIIEWIIFIFSLEIAVIFFIRYKKQNKKFRLKEELAYMSIFLGFALMELLFIKSDYYSSSNIVSPYFFWLRGSEREFFLNLGYLSIIFGALFFIYFIERTRNIAKIKYFITSVFGIIAISFIMIFIIDLTITRFFSLVFWPIFLLFLVIYLRDFSNRTRDLENFLKNASLYFLAFLLLPIGYFLTIDFSIAIFGLFIRLIGSLMELLSLSIIFHYFLSFPYLFEFDWKDRIEELFLITKEGACIFYKNLGGEETDIDKNLISSSITSINIMLQELTPSPNKKGFSRIKEQDKIIYLYNSELLDGVIISKEEIERFEYYLELLVLKVEGIYRDFLIEWDGDIDIFSPVDNIFDEVFSDEI